MTLLQFRNEDARIVYLATVYHLGRPGAESRAVASDAGGQGLQAIYDEVLPRLNQAVIEVEASPQQILRLNDALLGVANELKQFGIADDVIAGIDADVIRRVNEATETCKAAPPPPLDLLTTDVYADGGFAWRN